MENQPCEHLKSFKVLKADKYYCEECIKTGDSWLHLRVCQACDVVLCCNSSPNRHASKHARLSHHPVIISAEPGDDWAYCYIDDLLIAI